MAAPLPCITGKDKLGHPNSTFPECTHLGTTCHGLWPFPDHPLPDPFPASWPLHCSSNPSLTPHPPALTAPELSWHLNQSIFLKADREAGQPYLEVSRILKRVISSIQSEFVALKVWLTITYNMSFENQGFFFSSVQKCPFEQKTWVPLGKVLCFSGTWPPHAEWGVNDQSGLL